VAVAHLVALTTQRSELLEQPIRVLVVAVVAVQA
jgi:hypothetical protein